MIFGHHAYPGSFLPGAPRQVRYVRLPAFVTSDRSYLILHRECIEFTGAVVNEAFDPSLKTMVVHPANFNSHWL